MKMRHNLKNLTTHYSRNDRSSLVWIALITATLLAACGAQGTSASTGGQHNSPSLNDPAQILSKAKAAGVKDIAGPCTTTVDTGDGDVTTSTGICTLNFPPNPMRYASTITLKSQGATDSKFDIVYDYATNKLYGRSDGGAWQAVDASAITGSASVPVNFYTTLTQVKLAGVETVNGKSAYHLTGGLPVPSGAKASDYSQLEGDVWLDTGNYYPLRYHDLIVSSSGSTTVKDETTLNFTSWNTGNAISLPVVSG
jgi:hypothetical protein